MQSVFGQIFVCDDQATAKKVSQMQNGFTCVTRQGDKYETTGVLSGGSVAQGDSLKKIHEYMAMNSQRREVTKAIYDLKEQAKTLKG